MIDPMLDLQTSRTNAATYAYNMEMLSEVYYFFIDKVALFCGQTYEKGLEGMVWLQMFVCSF